MKHIRLFAHVFGIKYCLIGKDLPEAACLAIGAAAQVFESHLPGILTVEVTDHA